MKAGTIARLYVTAAFESMEGDIVVAIARQSTGESEEQAALTIVTKLEVVSSKAWMSNCRVPVQCVNHHSVCLSSLDEDYDFWVREYRIRHREGEAPKDWVLPKEDCPKCRWYGSEAAHVHQACFVLLPAVSS